MREYLSFLHHKRHKALHKAVAVRNKRTDVQHNWIHHLEDTMIMYECVQFRYFDRPYIDTVHRMQNFTTWNEKTHWKIAWLDGDIFSRWRCVQLCHKFCTIFDYSERKICEKVWKIYWGTEIIYYKALRVLSKGYLPISLLPPSKLEKILKEVRIGITKSNKDYDLVLTRLYQYYDMKLVTFGIDNQRNLIVQFPVFVQPYTQKRLIMYQIEIVPVPLLGENEQATFIHRTENRKTIYCFKWRNIYNIAYSWTENV